MNYSLFDKLDIYYNIIILCIIINYSSYSLSIISVYINIIYRSCQMNQTDCRIIIVQNEQFRYLHI